MDGMVQWGTFLRIRLQFPERFTPSRCLISQGCALPASPAGKLLYRAFGCRVYRNAPERLQKNLPRRGRGTARRRWMRGGTAFYIVGTMGAEGIKPSLTVGNGLCAVPGRGNDNPCANKPEPPPDMSFRANGSEPRNLPKWQVLSCGGSLSHVVDSSAPLALKA